MGIVGCTLMQCGADWCSLLNVGLLHIGAGCYNLVQFGAT